MDAEDLIDLVTRQIDSATLQMRAQLTRNESTGPTRALIKSLKHSLEAFSAGVDPVRHPDDSFVVQVAENGEIVLRQDSRIVDIGGIYVDTLFHNAGISLVKGQTLIVEPGFAKRIVEEALGETMAEQARLEKRRASLSTALRQSTADWREELLQEVRRLDDRRAVLVLRALELSGMNQAAEDHLQNTRVLFKPENAGARTGAA